LCEALEAWLAELLLFHEEAVDGKLLVYLDHLVEAFLPLHVLEDIGLKMAIDNEYGQSIDILERLSERLEDLL